MGDNLSLRLREMRKSCDGFLPGNLGLGFRSLVFLCLSPSGESVNNEPARDIDNHSANNADRRPIRLELFEWYHWLILFWLCFFNGAGMCALWRLLTPNRYSAAKTPYNTGRPWTGFDCVSCRLYYSMCDYDIQNVPGKGCVRHRQPQIEIAGPDAGGSADEALQFAHGGGVCAMGAAVLEIPSGSGRGVAASPRVGRYRSCGVPQSSGQRGTCGGGHTESSVIR